MVLGKTVAVVMVTTTRSCWRDDDNDAGHNGNGSFTSRDVNGAIGGNSGDDNYCDNNRRTMMVKTTGMVTEVSTIHSDDRDGGNNNAVDVDNAI